MPGKIKNISVLMPAYNCGKYISQATGSILNQTFKNFEFVIIDDGSTDNTEEIVNSFKDSRIIYRKTENKGTAAALNYGLSLCSNELVARIDADDLNVTTRLETQINFLEENPDYDVVSSWSVYFKDPCKILFLLKEPVENNDIHNYLDLHNPLNQSAVIYKKDLILKEKYNESFLYNEDFELFYRIRDKARFYNIPRFLAYTRVRADSKTFSRRNRNLFDMLFNPAFKNLVDAKSKGSHFYWASTIAWINYFYGKREDSRSYFKNSFSWKNLLAYFTTFLGDEYFHKFIDSRFKYRLKNIFTNTKGCREELKNLLK